MKNNISLIRFAKENSIEANHEDDEGKLASGQLTPTQKENITELQDQFKQYVETKTVLV